MVDRPTRRCIISRDQLQSGDFVAALQASLCPEDRLEIIMDRRRRGSAGTADPDVDRRHLREVDFALEANGFAIIPTSADRMGDGIPLSLLPSETSIEHPSLEDDEELVASISNRHGPSDTLIRILGVLIGLTIVSLVLSLGQIGGQNLIGQLFTESHSSGPGQPAEPTYERSAAWQLSPAARETHTVAETREASTPSLSSAPDSESSSDSPAKTKSVSPRDGDRLTPRQREMSGPSEVTDTARRASDATSRATVLPPEDASSASRVASPPSNETGARPKAETDQDASGGRPRRSATMRSGPKASVGSKQVTGSEPAESATTPAQSAGPRRAELVGKPVSRGWGDSYAVRLLDSVGQPVQVSGVLLVAHMADGSVETIAMGALPEPGMHRGTVPTGRGTPIELRVRVGAGDDKFVEILVTP